MLFATALFGILSYHRMHAQPLMKTVWPWVLARAAGLAAYAVLTDLVLLGLLMSHPVWKRHLSKRLFVWHGALAVGVFALVAVHGIAMVLDRYAGVSWQALIVPGLSRHRPLPVALGVLGAEALTLMAVSAHLAKNLGRRKWMTLHRWAVLTWALILGHSLWSGTDSRGLIVFYDASAVAVGLAALLRYGMDKSAAARTQPPAAGRQQI